MIIITSTDWDELILNAMKNRRRCAPREGKYCTPMRKDIDCAACMGAFKQMKLTKEGQGGSDHV